jgi:rubrerythrin
VGFDIDTYKRLVRPVEIDDIDFDAFKDHPLDDATLRCLRYMHDVESHTVCYLRDLLVTRAHRDPEMTTFLTFWNYEEYWHGEAIGRVLGAHAEPAGRDRIEPMRTRISRKEAIAPLTSMAMSAAIKDFGAVHMTWGAINEWTTQAGYSRLAQKANHPVLSDLLKRIMRQEGRHIDFYATQARKRLDASKAARRITRLALARFWRPVGSGVMPALETRFLIRHLFDGDTGRAMAERIDRRIDSLPGLAGLALITGSLATAGR